MVATMIMLLMEEMKEKEEKWRTGEEGSCLGRAINSTQLVDSVDMGDEGKWGTQNSSKDFGVDGCVDGGPVNRIEIPGKRQIRARGLGASPWLGFSQVGFEGILHICAPEWYQG